MDESQDKQPQENQKKTARKSAESSIEKQKKELAELRSKLQKKEALYHKRLRKERDGQLIALGVLAEMIYKAGGQGAKVLKEAAQANLKDRNLERVTAAFARLDGEARPDSQAAPQDEARG